MKEIKVGQLKVGDVFIDEDRCSVMESADRIFFASGMLKPWVKVKCIVGPTVQTSFTGVYIKSNSNYYLPLSKIVQLCEEQDEESKG